MGQEQKGHAGEVPNVVPSFGTGFGSHWGSSAAWGDAACVIPWVCYEFSGDPSILEDQYESMRGWVEFIRSVDKEDHGWRRHFHFGDWLALDAPDSSNLHGGTDVGYVYLTGYGGNIFRKRGGRLYRHRRGFCSRWHSGFLWIKNGRRMR